MSFIFLRYLHQFFFGASVSASYNCSTQAVASNGKLIVCLFFAVLTLASCGGGGSGGSNNASLSDSFVPITVSIDQTLPPEVLNSIAMIISPTGEATPGSQIAVSTNGEGHESIVLAVDKSDNILLASLVNNDTLANSTVTSLNAETTATVLVRLAIGQVPQGISPNEMNSLIQSSSEYPNLVALIQASLENGEITIYNKLIQQSVALVTTEIAPDVTNTVTSNNNTVTSIIARPRIFGSDAPFALIPDVLPVRIDNGTSSSSPDPVLTNEMPIPWHVTVTDSLNRTSAKHGDFLLDARTSLFNIISHPILTDTAAFSVTVQQDIDTQKEIVKSLLVNFFEFVLDFLPNSCSDNTVEAVLTSEIEARYGSGVLNNEEMKNFILNMIAPPVNLSKILYACVKEETLQKFIGRYLTVVVKYTAILSGADVVVDGATVVAIKKYSDKYIHKSQIIGVCLKDTFLRPRIVNCAENYEFDPKGLYAGLGVDVLQHTILNAFDEKGKLTALSSDLIYTSDGSIIQVDPNSKTSTTVNIGSTLVTAQDPATDAFAVLAVNVVDPGTIAPNPIQVNVGEYQGFRITDGKDNDIIPSPDVKWTTEDPNIAVTLGNGTFGGLFGGVTGVRPGTTTLTLSNPKTGRSSNAKIVVVRVNNLLANPEFEIAEPTIGEYAKLPQTTGQWEGDTSEIVGSSDGIVPASGDLMLRFEQTLPGRAGHTLGSQVYQIVDLSSFSDDISRGNFQLRASFLANRITGNRLTDTQFRVGLYAYGGDYATLEEPTPTLSTGFASIFSDGDITTWEPVEVFFNVPIGTTFVMMEVAAVEDIYDDTSGNEFQGHYADDAKLEVVKP